MLIFFNVLISIDDDNSGNCPNKLNKQRNRRKAFAPQRAIPPIQTTSVNMEDIKNEDSNDITPFQNNADEIEEGEDDQEVDNDNIFKGLQEEAGMEKNHLIKIS